MGFNFNNSFIKNICFNAIKLNNVFFDGTKVYSSEKPLEEDWYYTEDANNVTLTKYIGKGNIVNIPDRYHNKDVILSTNAFLNASEESRSNIESVSMNKSLLVENNSMSYMFSNMTSLRSVDNIPSSVTNLDYTFSNTSIESIPNLSNVTTLDNTFVDCHFLYQLKESDLPESVTTLNSTFYNCNNLTYLSIKNTVNNIHNSFGNTNISTLYLNDGIKNLSNSFTNCTNLKSIVHFPNNDFDMSYAFSNCTNLVNVADFDNANATSSFHNCSNITTLPNIGDNCILDATFAYCINIINVTNIPNVDRLSYTFMGCESIKSDIQIPNTVTDLSGAFIGCTNVTNVVLSTNTDSLYRTFEGCTNISNVYINGSAAISNVTNTFVNTSKTKSLYVETKLGADRYSSLLPLDGKNGLTVVPEGFDIIDWKYDIDTSTINLTKFINTSAEYSFIPTTYSGKNVLLNLDNTFSGASKLTKVISSSYSYTNSMYNTFNGCRYLTNVFTVPSCVTSMESTFYDCNKLTNVNISNSVTSMTNTFVNTGFTSTPNIPDSVTNLYGAFARCNNLTKMNYLGNSIKSLENTFNRCKNLRILSSIPTTVTTMSSTFYSCTNITTVPIIPSSVENVSYLFARCTNVGGDITFENENMKNMISTFAMTGNTSKYVFCNGLSYTNAMNRWDNSNHVTVYSRRLFDPSMFICSNIPGTMTLNTLINKSVSRIVVPSIYKEDKIRLVGHTFKDSPNLQTVELDNDIINCDLQYAFRNCTNLVCVPTIPESTVNMAYTFDGCTNMKKFPIIPDNVDDLSYTFSNCTNLTDMPIIPNRVYNISHSFENCDKLQNVTDIPDSVTSSEYTFANCTNLTTPPVLGNRVASIGYGFYNCTNLTKTPDIPDSVVNMVSTFEGCTGLTSVSNLGNGIYTLYKTFNACSNLVSAPNIPDSVVNLSSTFYMCSKLNSIGSIGSNVKNMDLTFSFTSVGECPDLPESVTNMNSTFAFSSLSSINYIPKNVVYMNGTFRNSQYSGVLPIFSGNVVDIDNCFYGTPGNKTVYAIGDTYNLARSAIHNKNNTVVMNLFTPNRFTCTSNVSNVMYLANYNKASTLNFLYIPATHNGNSVTLNAVNGFANSTRLQYVYIEEGVNVDNGYRMFTNAFNLCHAEIPNSVTNLEYAFCNCNNLTCVPTLPSNVTNLENTFLFCNSITKVPSIPNTVTSLYRTFCECINLQETPDIPESVTNMTDTFWHCHSLPETKFNNNVQDLSGAYSECYSLTCISEIPESVTNMRGTFANCNMITSSPNIPFNVTNMHTTFTGCSNLTGDIYITAPYIYNAVACFNETALAKNVYIKPSSITNTTFQSLYGSKQNGVTLKSY